MQPISYGRQSIIEEDIQSVIEVLKSDYLTQGPEVLKFEQAFAEYVGARYAVAVANGTAALHLCAIVLDVGAGDVWLTTPITFAASANCIKFCGGDIEFVDIDPDTYCIDLEKLEMKLESAPEGTYKGVIAVDFAGFPVDMKRLYDIATRHKLKVIEDACHAPGGYFVEGNADKQKCGNGKYADMAIFSFHPVKHIATGEGGMITTNDKELFERLCLYRTHGITKDSNVMEENHGGWYYEMVDLGYNYRLSDIQAALGYSQLKRASVGLKRRRDIASYYNKAFSKVEGIKIPKVSNNIGHAYHLYVIQVSDRKGLYDFLKESQIFCQVHYIPVHLMPYYKSLGCKIGDMPIAEEYYKHCLSLPMFPTLTEIEQQFVIDKVIEFIER